MCCHESHNVIDLTKGIVFAAVRYGRCFQVTLGTKKTVLVPCNKQEFTILSSCLRDCAPSVRFSSLGNAQGDGGQLGHATPACNRSNVLQRGESLSQCTEVAPGFRGKPRPVLGGVAHVFQGAYLGQ